MDTAKYIPGLLNIREAKVKPNKDNDNDKEWPKNRIGEQKRQGKMSQHQGKNKEKDKD